MVQYPTILNLPQDKINRQVYEMVLKLQEENASLAEQVGSLAEQVEALADATSKEEAGIPETS